MQAINNKGADETVWMPGILVCILVWIGIML